MKITQVEPQKTFRLRSGRVPQRFNIYLDGKFAFGADEDLVVEKRLIVGKQLDNSELESLIFEAEVGKLMERMYGLFGRRQRSEKEVKDYLRNLSFKRKIKGKEEISDLVIDAAVEKLKQKGLINDKDFAKKWAEARRINKKRGKRAIMAELLQKGLDREDIVEALENDNSQTEEKLAQEALEKKMDRWKKLTPLEKKKKVYEFLARRGFDYDVIKDVVEKYLERE